MEPIPRKHHFLPVFYLKNFCTESGNLYVYERGKPPRKSIPKSEAHIRDFYSFNDESGRNVEVEKALSKYESEAAPIIQEIVDRQRTRSPRLLEDNEIEILRNLVALTFVRVPAGRKLDQDFVAPAVRRLFEDAAKDPQKFAALIKQIPDNEPLSEEERIALIEDVRLRILNGYYDQPEPPWFRLHAMLHVASMIAEELRDYNCLVVLATKHEAFITGDTPVVTATEQEDKAELGTSFASKDNGIWFPISTKVCLAWRRGLAPGYGKLPPRGVRMVNRNTMRFAERFIYASKNSPKLANVFARTKQQVFLGKNAFIPLWEDKPILEE